MNGENNTKEIDKKIPIFFQQLENYDVEDIRFTKVKIWIMHLGDNYNGSYFSKEVVEEAIPSLANTPILGYIECNSDDDIDFSDHRMILIKKDGKYEYKYICSPIGTIPETNNAQFEKRVCDDGTEREFLTVEGLVWKKWSDVEEILDRDVTKNQSMELADDYEGEFNKDDNLFYFSKFKFFGSCVLGKDYSPGMESSTIELQFCNKGFYQDIQKMMEKFKNFSKNKNNENQESEVNNCMTKKVNTNFALSNDNFEKEVRNILKTKTVVVTDWWGDTYEENEFYYRDRKDNYVIVVKNDYSEYYGIPYTENGDKVTLDFDSKVPFIHEWRAKEEGDTDVITNFTKEEIEVKFTRIKEKAEQKTREQFSAKNTEEYKELQSKYNTLQTDFSKVKEENKSMPTKDGGISKTDFEKMSNDLKELQTKFSIIIKENETLTQFKEKAEKETLEKEVDEVVLEFTTLKNQEKLNEYKQFALDKKITVEELNEKLFALEGMELHEKKVAQNFSKKDSSTVKIPNKQEDENNDCPYGSLSHLFK